MIVLKNCAKFLEINTLRLRIVKTFCIVNLRLTVIYVNLVSISVRATPVPIPNTTVKPNGAHDTAGEALWESRLSPVIGSLAQLVRATGS